MILVKPSDFVGFQLVSVNNQTTPTLQAYIDRYERLYLRKILGVVLADLFIADLANVSQNPRFAVIQQPLAFEQGLAEYISTGLKDILVSLIYYHYVARTQSGHSSTGIYGSINEAQTNKSDADASRYGEQRWNEALSSIETIQFYCHSYANQLYASTPAMQYPEYNGQDIPPRFVNVL